MPQLSIIVPVYNTEKYLHRCVDSILIQTYTDFELILVDDSSTDGCGRICDEYATKDLRVRVIHQENGGVSSARNAGLRVAQGTFVLFVDSDDYVNQHYVKRLVDNQSDLTICGYDIKDEYGNNLRELKYKGERFLCKNEIDYTKLYSQRMLFSPYCKLFKRRIIIENNIFFSEGTHWGEDGMFVADYLKHVDSLFVIEDKGYNYIKYRGKETLSTGIKSDIADTISFAREYCINKAKDFAPAHYDEIREFCVEDIKKNIAYFLKRVIGEHDLFWSERRRILARFLSNPYVKEIIVEAEHYFPNNTMIPKCLQKRMADLIILDYCFRRTSERIKAWLYLHIYEKQPETVKKAYRSIKGILKR